MKKYILVGLFFVAILFNVTKVEAQQGCCSHHGGVYGKNYNKNANQNDGSCIYYKKGCTDVNSINYDENAEVDDGNCIKKVIGCMDNTAKNYNPNANVNENCVYEEKEIDIEEDKESNGLVATLLTLGTVGTSVVLIKKRH